MARFAIHYICPADRDLKLLPLVDCSPSLSPVDSDVVYHTAVVVDLDLAMRYSLEVTWLITLIVGPNRGLNKRVVTANPIVCDVDRIC